MNDREDSIYYSDDEDSFEEFFWSESEEEDSLPVCMGCQCKEKTCQNVMPSTGSVQWGSLWDVQDYIELSARLLTIGVKLQYQCLRCLECNGCLTDNKIYLKSLEYKV